MQKAVGGDQGHPGMVRPAGHQRLQHPGKGALAHRHAASNADDVGAHPHQPAEKVVAHPRQRLGRPEVQVEQSRQGQVDIHHLLQRHLVVDAAQGDQLGLGQCERRAGAQPGPVGPAEALVGCKVIHRGTTHRVVLFAATVSVRHSAYLLFLTHAKLLTALWHGAMIPAPGHPGRAAMDMAGLPCPRR